MDIGVIGDHHSAESQDDGAHAAEEAFGDAALGRSTVFQQIAQGDQAAENLVRCFQPDDRLGGAVAGRASGAKGVHDGGTRCLDRVAGGAAMDPGVRFPGGVGDRRRLHQGMKVSDELRGLAVGFGDGPPGRQERIDAPDDHRQQDRPQRTADERGCKDAGFRRAGDGAIERQDLHGRQQCAQLLRRLAVDAREGGAEQPKHAERQGNGRPKCAEEAVSSGHGGAGQSETEQHRDAPADRAAGIADTGQERGQRGLSECREFSVFVEGDDDGDREAGSHALREADGSDVDDDRQSREVGCSGQEGRRHAGLLPLPLEKVAQQCFRCRFADPADDLGAVVAR